MRFTVELSKKEAEEMFEKLVAPTLFPTNARVTSVEWTSYSSKVTIEATDVPADPEDAA